MELRYMDGSAHTYGRKNLPWVHLVSMRQAGNGGVS